MQDGNRDRMADLAHHLVKQRHVYPCFPPAAAACLDFAHERHLQLPQLPDVLLLPSRLAPSAKAISHVHSTAPQPSGARLILWLAVPGALLFLASRCLGIVKVA